MTATNSRACILAALDRRPAERVPMIETTIWPETLARWHAEGLPAGADPVDHFGLDRIACINDLFDPSFGLPERELERTAEQRTYVDRYGKTIREWVDRSAVPSVIAPALRTAAEWEQLKPRLRPGPEKFNNPPADADYQAALAAGHATAITPPDPIWFIVYQVFGFEHGLMAMARQPELVADMAATYTEYLIGMLDLAWARGYRFDALWHWSDLCYRNGLLFSPRAAQRFAVPHWKPLGDWAHAHGMRFVWHCDGDVRPLIPLLLEAGLDAIHPLEARAGNDVRALKQQYGQRLCLIGNINADVLATNDRAAIEREVAEKVPVAAVGGGYIYHTDHSVPPTVSLESYAWLIECVRRYGTWR